MTAIPTGRRVKIKRINESQKGERVMRERTTGVREIQDTAGEVRVREKRDERKGQEIDR